MQCHLSSCDNLSNRSVVQGVGKSYVTMDTRLTLYDLDVLLIGQIISSSVLVRMFALPQSSLHKPVFIHIIIQES